MKNGGKLIKTYMSNLLYLIAAMFCSKGSKIKKIVLSCMMLIFPVLLFSCGIKASAFEVLNETYTEKIISKGVTQYNYNAYTVNGPVRYSVIIADLNMPHLNVEPLYSQRGIKNLVNTKILASQNKALAAINADFFAWNYALSGTGSPLGTVVDNNKMISSPKNDFAMNSLMVDYDGTVNIGFFNHYTYVVSVKNGLTLEIACINKYDEMQNMCMYDTNWGETFESIYDGICKIVVDSEGKVVNVTGEKGSIKIPDGGYILTCLSDKEAFNFVSQNIELGDTLKVETVTNIEYDKLKSAIGGGSLLLANGQVTEITHGDKGRNPRSAVGTDTTGKILYMVAVDGRQSSSVGVTLNELAHIMLKVGAKNAMNFDGGGSTTLVSRDVESQSITLANSPSDNYLRPVSDALGITQNITPTTNKLDNIKLFTDHDSKNVFKNTSLNIKIRGYDEYYNEVAIDSSNVEFIVEGVKGSFDGMDFIPSEAGMSKVTAVVEGIRSTIYIKVLDKPSKLYFDKKTLNISDGDIGWIILYGVDVDGYTAPINIRNLSKDQLYCPSFVDVGDYSLIKTGQGEDLFSVKIGGVTAHLGVTTLDRDFSMHIPEGITEDDEKMFADTSENSYKINFLGSGIPNTLLNRFITEKEIKISNDEAKVTVFSGNVEGLLSGRIDNNYIASDEYSEKNIDGNLFITLDNSEGSFNKVANSQQWQKMNKALESSNVKNIFVVLTHSIDSITSSDELSAFKYSLEHFAFSGKNIFLLCPGNENKCKAENGVRYFYISDGSVKLSVDEILSTKYLSISIYEDDFSYYFEQSFKK